MISLNKPDTVGEQGKRTDLLVVKEKIDQGASEAEIADNHFVSWTRHYKSFREYKRMKTDPRSWKTDTTVVIGPTGTGKSTFANGVDTPENTYFKQNSIWWDGYEGQPTVVLDDFYGWLKYDEMLRLMDRYPLLVQTKGGQSQFLAHSLILTSNTFPKDWYSKIYGTKTGLSAFNRRVDRWIYMGNLVSIAGKTWSEFEENMWKFNDLLE